MNTLKEKIYGLCEQIAANYPEWKFSAGKFKNSSLKHTELIVDPGLSFDRGFGHLQPNIYLNNKRASKLSKLLLGEVIPTACISFQVIAHLLVAMPESLKLSCLICDDKSQYLAAIRQSGQFTEKVVQDLDARSIDLSGAPIVLTAMLEDGISFIEKHYKFTSENTFLQNLPAKYTTHNEIPYDEMERLKGVMVCLVRIILGEFEFVEQYQADDFKTVFPKRTNELGKIMLALPGLKKRYAESGSVF
jgi:hypothetical protein